MLDALSTQVSTYEFPVSSTVFHPAVDNHATLLRTGDESEVLSFLAARPLQTVFMAGLVRDNGLVSEANRGDFYGYRTAPGRLEGVALIGHATLFETLSSDAVAAFAQVARTRRDLHMIMGERHVVNQFWQHYAVGGQTMRLAARELLYVLDRVPAVIATAGDEPPLQPAVSDFLSLIAPVHARMAFDESGVNPLDTDPEGFLRRCERRIEADQVYVLVRDQKLVFKADIFADTPEAVYLEGVYVSPDERRNGLGLRCVSYLARRLLRRASAVCVLVNEANTPAQALYERVGFQKRGEYDTIFLSGAGQLTSPGQEKDPSDI